MIDVIRRRLVPALLGLAALAAAATAHAQPIKTDLADLVLGRADAPVTIEEYASLTCGHCAAFHTTVLPQLKTKYVDTGKVKFVYRDFPLDELAVGAAMLGRCGGESKREAIVGALYKSQATWMGAGKKPLDELYKLGRQMGLTQPAMETCFSNEAMLAAIVAQRNAFDAQVNIQGTPTFVINGRKLEGPSDLAAFDKALAPLVKP